MKKSCLLIFIILLCVPFILFAGLIGYLKFDKFIKQHRSYNELYSSKADKELAYIIENSILQISKSKHNQFFDKTINNLDKFNLEFSLNDINNVCYSSNIYNTQAEELLKSIGVNYKHANLIEDKRQNSYGEGSNLLLLIKTDKTILPIFSADYFMTLKTKLKFSQLKMMGGCAEIPNHKLQIKVNSSLKEKALLILE